MLKSRPAARGFQFDCLHGSAGGRLAAIMVHFTWRPGERAKTLKQNSVRADYLTLCRNGLSLSWAFARAR
jgi:hypothetical protein